jgi:hypothetical protein
MKVQATKRIAKEDFPQEYQELIDKIAFAINPTLEALVLALSKNLDFDNLSWKIVSLDVETDDSSPYKLKRTTAFRTTVKNKIKGIVCVSAQNLSNPDSFVVQQPFINFVESGANTDNRLVNVKYVTGLASSSKYRLSLMIIT